MTPDTFKNIDITHPDEETIMARIIQDGQSLCVILLEYVKDRKVWRVRREDRDTYCEEYDTYSGALRVADGYLAGFEDGFQEGIAHASKNFSDPITCDRDGV